MQDRNGTKLSPLKLVGTLSSEQQPFVLLRATSASKIRCKAPLYVTVKGHWERSTTFTARLHCISTVARIVTHYLQAESTNWQPKHPLSILLPYGQRCLFVCLFVCFLCGFFFSSFIRKKNCVTAHPDLALLPRADPCTGCHAFKTTFPRHLIVTNCTVKLSTGSACLWCTERRQQHSRSDPKHKSPVTSHTKKTTSILSMHIKVIVLLWYTVHRQSSSWLHLHTNTCCYTSVQCYSKVTDFKLN